MTILPTLREFISQGFHLQTHPVQTVVTFALLLAALYLVIEVIIALVDRIRAAIILIKNDACITKTEWFEHKRLVGEIKSTADGAKTSAAVAAGAASQAATLAYQANDLARAAEGRAVQVEQKFAATPASTPATVAATGKLTESDIENSNAIDEIREELRLFIQDYEQRLLSLEVDATEPEEPVDPDMPPMDLEEIFLEPVVAVKRGRGRPKGSKNKKKSKKRR